MRSVEEAAYMLQTFNKIIPYIDNCAGLFASYKMNLESNRGQTKQPIIHFQLLSHILVNL